MSIGNGMNQNQYAQLLQSMQNSVGQGYGGGYGSPQQIQEEAMRQQKVIMFEQAQARALAEQKQAPAAPDSRLLLVEDGL